MDFNPGMKKWTFGDNTITNDGMRSLTNWFRESYGINRPEWWPNLWCFEKPIIHPQYDDAIQSKLRGSLAKRMKTYLKFGPGIKCDEHCIDNFCCNISAYSVRHKRECLIEFTQRFDWNAGDYCDSGSCFWGCRSQAKELMQDEGYWAILIHDKEGNGIGRAWIGEDQARGHRTPVIFNYYGPNTISITDLAAVVYDELYPGMSTGTSPTFATRSLYNYGNDCGLIYINGSTCVPVVGPGENLYSDYDLELGTPGTQCSRCDGFCDDDDFVTDAYGNVVCQGCIDSDYFWCEDRGGWYIGDDVVFCVDTDDYRDPDMTFYCESCNNAYRHDSGIESDFDGECRCQDCHTEHLSEIEEEKVEKVA